MNGMNEGKRKHLLNDWLLKYRLSIDMLSMWKCEELNVTGVKGFKAALKQNHQS